MNKLKLFGVMSTVALTSTAFSYQVWIGTSYTPKAAITDADRWDRTAALASGMIINLTDAQLPQAEQNTDEDWKTILAKYAVAKNNSLSPIARSGVRSTTFPNRPTIAQFLTERFNRAAEFGFNINFLMIYNNQTVGESFPWLEEEVQEMRNWLNNNGRANVKLVWNARNFGPNDQFWTQNSLIDVILLEAEPGKWFENVGRRQELLRWITTTPATQNKSVIFQVPMNNVDPTLTPSREMRKLVRWISTPAMLGSTDFVRRANVIFMPVSYFGEIGAYRFYPETTSTEDRYVDSLTGTVLSLIEQRNAFEGRPTLISESRADSLTR